MGYYFTFSSSQHEVEKMNDFIINDPRIKPLIEKGVAQILDSKYCETFNEYLCAEYPWLYSGKIDWDNVQPSYKRFRWDNVDEEATTIFLKQTCLVNFNEVCIVYGAKQPGLIVTFEYACKELENLTIFGWSTRFVVGVERDKYGIISLANKCFVEVDFADWLTASS